MNLAPSNNNHETSVTLVKQALGASKNSDFQKKTLVWISSLVLDVYLHKTSRIEILSQLAKRGWNVYLVGTRSRNRVQFQSSGIRTVAVPSRDRPPISTAVYNLALLFFLPFYVTRIRPDFVVLEPNEHFFSFLPTRLLCRFRGVKTVLDIRSVPVTRDTQGSRGFRKMFVFDACMCIAKKSFDGITTITLSMKNDICKGFAIDRRQVGVWSSGASPTVFAPEKYIDDASKLKSTLGLSGKFVIFYHGVLSSKRGLEESIDAVSMARKENPEIVLFILGNGSTAGSLRTLVKSRMVQENVVIHDGVDYSEVPKYIAMCDVGIVPLPDLPYWRSQCPLNLLEYLAMKKPVIVSDIPANREIVGNGRFALYISSSKPEEIARALTSAYLNREELKRAGESARNVVTQKYNWKIAAESLASYLLSIDA